LALSLGTHGGLAIGQVGYKGRVLTVVRDTDASKREVRVNFGVFAGRSATAAEIDDLARALLPELGDVTIVAEDRRELSGDSETSLHQVRIEVPEGAEVDRVVALAEEWAQAQIEERHAEVVEAPEAAGT
jgi:hypothetical protein